MKKITLLLLTILLITVSEKTFAQTDKKIEDFVAGIDSYLTELGNKTSKLYTNSSMNNRKIKISGKFDNDTKIFKQTIKYYKGGLKKEIIEIDFLAERKAKPILRIVLLNDKYYSIEKITYSDDNYTKKTSKETLIDSKIYKKIEFDKTNKEVYTYSWKL